MPSRWARFTDEELAMICLGVTAYIGARVLSDEPDEGIVDDCLTGGNIIREINLVIGNEVSAQFEETMLKVEKYRDE